MFHDIQQFPMFTRSKRAINKRLESWHTNHSAHGQNASCAISSNQNSSRGAAREACPQPRLDEIVDEGSIKFTERLVRNHVLTRLQTHRTVFLIPTLFRIIIRFRV
jgi:hypothetical protein